MKNEEKVHITHRKLIKTWMEHKKSHTQRRRLDENEEVKWRLWQNEEFLREKNQNSNERLKQWKFKHLKLHVADCVHHVVRR